MQSDRWTGPASYLAGSKLIAVMPVRGWWDQSPRFQSKSQPFSLIVTVSSPGLDLYSLVELALTPAVSITV